MASASGISGTAMVDWAIMEDFVTSAEDGVDTETLTRLFDLLVRAHSLSLEALRGVARTAAQKELNRAALFLNNKIAQMTDQNRDTTATKIDAVAIKTLSPPLPVIAPPEEVEILLPPRDREAISQQVSDGPLALALLPISRHVDALYQDMPWPKEVKNILVYTAVCGGNGDIVAAARAIETIYKMSPGIQIDWVVVADCKNYNAKSFLDPSIVASGRISIRYGFRSNPPSADPVDLMLVGPVAAHSSEAGDICQHYGRKLMGPVCAFREIGCSPLNILWTPSSSSSPSQIHSTVFPSPAVSPLHAYPIPMGIIEGTGVFLETRRQFASRDKSFSPSSYIPEIQENSLRKDLLESMGIADGVSQPKLEKYSLNFGYAHRASSWEKFIDCVAMHEKNSANKKNNKDVIIVLNQKGAVDEYFFEDFKKMLLQKLDLLKNKGFGKVVLKSKDEASTLLDQGSKEGSSFTVMIRPSFSPRDMERLQLASDRLLSTGNNSAVESWCARCKLYLYESVYGSDGFGQIFLQHQVDRASEVSRNLGRFLALAGGDIRSVSARSVTQPFAQVQIKELEEILEDPNLEKDTLNFCDCLVKRTPFQEIVTNSLKRTIWHSRISELVQIEREGLGKEFYEKLGLYFSGQVLSREQSVVRVRSLKAIQDKLRKRMAK
ncbi:MAG: DUF562 domain-containing protein [Chlamydiia bacterium]|nr:DUF562 domain-containing protein [Chlamydiia bacterium]